MQEAVLHHIATHVPELLLVPETAVDLHCSGDVLRFVARQQVQQRRLARPAGADDYGQFTGAELAGQIF